MWHLASQQQVQKTIIFQPEYWCTLFSSRRRQCAILSSKGRRCALLSSKGRSSIMSTKVLCAACCSLCAVIQQAVVRALMRGMQPCRMQFKRAQLGLVVQGDVQHGVVVKCFTLTLAKFNPKTVDNVLMRFVCIFKSFPTVQCQPVCTALHRSLSKYLTAQDTRGTPTLTKRKRILARFGNLLYLQPRFIINVNCFFPPRTEKINQKLDIVLNWYLKLTIFPFLQPKGITEWLSSLIILYLWQKDVHR